MKDYSNVMEWELAREHNKALVNEDYETCNDIQQEVDKRIEDGTIDHVLMQSFMRYDHIKKEFVGSPKYEGLNGLFDKYTPVVK